MLSADNPYYRQVTLLIELLPLVAGAAIEAALRGVKIVYLGRTDERITKFQVRRSRERVQIEVSPVLRGSVHEPVLRETSATVTAQFGLIRMPILHPLELYAGKLCAALDRQHPRDLFDVMQLQQAEGIDRALFDVFLVYLISGDRPIAEMLAPRFMSLSRPFSGEFSGMTLVAVTPKDLEAARQRLVTDLRAMLTETDKEFLLSVKRGNVNWQSFAHPDAQRLPAVQWKLRNIAKMTAKKRIAAAARLEAVLG